MFRGYGFVQFERVEEAEAAKAGQNGRFYKGYKLGKTWLVPWSDLSGKLSHFMGLHINENNALLKRQFKNFCASVTFLDFS